MNEDFVPFELAKKLKEKVFNEVCYDYYEPLKHCLNKIKTPLTNKDGESCDVITAPTISQVLKWLREEKNIFVVVFIDDDSDFPVTYNIFKGTDCVYHHHEEYFALSEWGKCEIAGIEYTLNNLI